MPKIISRPITINRGPRTQILFIRGSRLLLKQEEIQVADRLFVGRVTKKTVAFLKKAGVENVKDVIGESKFWIASRNAVENADAERPYHFFKALVIAADSELLHNSSVILEEGQKPFVFNAGPSRNYFDICWGHYTKELNKKQLEKAAALLPGILNSGNDYNYHRVGNALMFYMNGYNAPTADFALIAFTTCLEGLFSTGEQELTFRLSLRVAHFLGGGEKGRSHYYRLMREVYRNRSKLVHGAPIAKDSEQAAIQLVERIVPMAETLARESLQKVFSLRLEGVFSNGEKVEGLFTHALFASSLKKALVGTNKETKKR